MLKYTIIIIIIMKQEEKNLIKSFTTTSIASTYDFKKNLRGIAKKNKREKKSLETCKKRIYKEVSLRESFVRYKMKKKMRGN
jgi:hypothetical protein